MKDVRVINFFFRIWELSIQRMNWELCREREEREILSQKNFTVRMEGVWRDWSYVENVRII